MSHAIAMDRVLLGKIVDDVFDGAIEDASVIEAIYAAIKKHESHPSPVDRGTVPCECTKVAQDETCPVGYPSLLCEICDGMGHVPAVKLDGPELWEIVFGIANDVAAEITDEQYQQIADAINKVFIDPVAASSTHISVEAEGPMAGWSSEEYARGYEHGVKESAEDKAWMTHKAWQDAVLMLVHHAENAERTWLVGAEEHARKRDEWWARCKALSATRVAEQIATVPVDPVAWLRQGENIPVQNVPFGAMWITDKDDPRGFPVYAMPADWIAGGASAEHISIECRFESGSLTEAGWPVASPAASKPAEDERSFLRNAIQEAIDLLLERRHGNPARSSSHNARVCLQFALTGDVASQAPALPQDVINLVVAAREFWDSNNDLSSESTVLDRALTAFSSRVPFENDPERRPA